MFFFIAISVLQIPDYIGRGLLEERPYTKEEIRKGKYRKKAIFSYILGVFDTNGPVSLKCMECYMYTLHTIPSTLALHVVGVHQIVMVDEGKLSELFSIHIID